MRLGRPILFVALVCATFAAAIAPAGAVVGGGNASAG
jgi:hypothetical protein